VDHSVTILEVLRQHRTASRSELAELTALSAATISRAVAKLTREGLVVERPGEPSGLGRIPRVVELRSGAAHVLGIDAGSSRIRAVVTDLDGSVRASASSVVRRTGDASAIVETIARTAREAREQVSRRSVLAAAVGVSGIVDRDTGRVLLSPDLPGLEDAELGTELERQLRLPVALDNDDLLAAIGEAAFGAAKDRSDVVFLSLGYGLGAGLIVGGRPVRGSSSSAGAIAYLAPGRMENRASGRVIPLRYLDRVAQRRSPDGLRPTTKIDAEEVLRRAAQGDAVAEAVVRDVLDALGDLVVNVAALLDPEVIVIGGGLTQSGRDFVTPLEDRLRNSVPYPPSLVRSALGDDAVARGAAVLALSIAKHRLAARDGASTPQPEPRRIGALELI
jgi:predicted NBD/HSP70 family sugar kinase